MNKVITEDFFRVDNEKDRKGAIELLSENELPVSDLDEGKKLFILKEDDSIIGTGGLEFFDECALLRSVSVKKEERGKSWGRYISRQLEKVAKAEGANCLYLLTTTAMDFFSKEGFVQVGRDKVPTEIQNSSEFTSVCPSTAVVMKKNLE
jgi:amino-acid N-acetyltransferase